MEKQPNPERKGQFLSAWKKFNKVTGFIWLALGVTFDQPLFYAAAGIDFLQNHLIGRYEKWRDRRKAGQQAGRLAVQAA